MLKRPMMCSHLSGTTSSGEDLSSQNKNLDVIRCKNTSRCDSGKKNLKVKFPFFLSLSASGHPFSPYMSSNSESGDLSVPTVSCSISPSPLSSFCPPALQSSILSTQVRIQKVMMITLSVLSGQTSFHYKI